MNPFVYKSAVLLTAGLIFLPPAWAADKMPAVKPAKDQKPPDAKTSFGISDFSKDSGQVDADALLKTVNETLKENRDVRKNLGTVQDAFERLTIENNVLKSRIRTAEGRAEEKERAKNEAGDEIKRRQEQIEALRKKNDEQLGTLEEQSRKMEQSKADIGKLKDKLGEAILESERDAFNAKLEALHRQSEDAVRELAKANYQTTQLQEELGESYYRMGNILFAQRNFEPAAGYYKKALHFNPQLSYAHYNLAIIYDYYLSDNPSALDHYRQYMEMGPDESDSQKIRERMLELKLLKNVVPKMPLKLDFNETHKKTS